MKINKKKFIYLISPNKISKKLQTFQHSEFKSKKFSSVDLIKNKIENLEDLFGRNHKYEKVIININSIICIKMQVLCK